MSIDLTEARHRADTLRRSSEWQQPLDPEAVVLDGGARLAFLLAEADPPLMDAPAFVVDLASGEVTRLDGLEALPVFMAADEQEQAQA